MQPGTRLDPYQIADKIGTGGMGEVYLATDIRLDRSVAIKVLPQHLAADPQRRERFEREAKVVFSLNHPHICTLHDVASRTVRTTSSWNCWKAKRWNLAAGERSPSFRSSARDADCRREA